MENKFEEKLKLGYEEYLKLPKAECSGVNRETELYTNRWYIMMGRSIVHPHPHRHCQVPHQHSPMQQPIYRLQSLQG